MSRVIFEAEAFSHSLNSDRPIPTTPKELDGRSVEVLASQDVPADISTLAQARIDLLTVQAGRLTTKTWGQRLVEIFGYGVKENKDTVKAYIAATIRRLSSEIRSSSGDERTAKIQQLKNFISACVKSTQLDVEYFDGRVVAEKVDGADIRSYLSPEIARLRAEKNTPDETRPGQTKKTNFDHIVKRKMAKAKLALELGVTSKANGGGATGSLVFKDIHDSSSVEGKPLGIYKSMVEPTPSLWKTLTIWARNLLGIRRQTDLCRNGGTIPPIYTEIAAAHASEHFGIHLTPGSSRLRIEATPYDGLFMAWCKRFKDASFWNPATPTPTEIELFQKMVVYDVFIGNLDRHGDNWMGKEDETNRDHIIDMRAIDNSNCFLSENPGDTWQDQRILRKQYQWKNLDVARLTFNEAARAKMREFSADGAIDGFLATLRTKFTGLHLSAGESFLNEAVIGQLRQRARLLEVMAGDAEATPELLGNLYTTERMEAYIRNPAECKASMRAAGLFH